MPILRSLRVLFRPPTDPAWSQWDDLADSFDLPREWVVCSHCGQQGWRFPPHQFDPCPLVIQMAEQAGLKFEAEAATSRRMGVHMEQLTRTLRQLEDEASE